MGPGVRAASRDRSRFRCRPRKAASGHRSSVATSPATPTRASASPAGIYISGYVARRLDASPHARALVWQAPEITGRYVSVELPEDFRTSQGMFFIGLQDVQPGETWPGLEGLEGGLTEPNP